MAEKQQYARPTQDCMVSEKSMNTCRLSVQLIGTDVDFLNGTPSMKIDPAVFDSRCLVDVSTSVVESGMIDMDAFCEKRTTTTCGTVQKRPTSQIVVKSVKLVTAVNTAAYPVSITVSQSGERSAYMDNQVCDASNASNRCLLVLPANTKLDHMKAPVSIVGFDNVAQRDMDILSRYPQNYTLDNIWTDVLRKETTVKGKVCAYHYVPTYHPLIHELMIHDGELKSQFESQRPVDNQYRVTEKWVSSGMEMVKERLRRSPVVKIGDLKFHAACSTPDLFRQVVSGGNPNATMEILQVHLILDFEYKII
jgi:hypothetical protein